MADHILGDSDIVVDLAVVDLEDQTDKVGQDGGTACLCLDRRGTLAGLGSNNGQSVYLIIRTGSRGVARGSVCPGSLRQRIGKKLIREMLTGQCVGLESKLVFVYADDEIDITLPYRAGALQYRCRPHDVLGIIQTRRCLRPSLMVHLSSSANPRSTDHISFIYALHVDDHLEAGSSLCLPSRISERT